MTSIIQVEEPITVSNPLNEDNNVMPSVGAEEPSLWDRVLFTKNKGTSHYTKIYRGLLCGMK
jgi:hypothetical protein